MSRNILQYNVAKVVPEDWYLIGQIIHVIYSLYPKTILQEEEEGVGKNK